MRLEVARCPDNDDDDDQNGNVKHRKWNSILVQMFFLYHLSVFCHLDVDVE